MYLAIFALPSPESCNSITPLTSLFLRQDGLTASMSRLHSFYAQNTFPSLPFVLSFELLLAEDHNLCLSPLALLEKIEVNTEVAEEHGKQGFEPYKIGVRLFKQYEGVNIVVYNQPVALIKYLADLDAFNYDVDYTKSILSVLTETEKILELKAAEERAQLKANISKSSNIILDEKSDDKKKREDS